MVVSEEYIQANYPVHFAVWNNDWHKVSSLLSSNTDQIEKLDPRGRTPLLLAVISGHVECVKILVGYNADATFVHPSGWNIIQEAVATGDPELLRICLEERDIQKRRKRSDLVPILLKRLEDAPDFYVEMKWEFSSWFPMIANYLPGNAYRVYKKGSNLRVDSSAVGFNDPGWQNGAITVIFKAGEDSFNMLEIDHATKQVFSSVILSSNQQAAVQLIPQHVIERSIAHWIGNPSMISNIDLEDISFERYKTGIFGWGSDKSEKISGFDCKVFSASNFKLVTKIRTEHLSETEKSAAESKSKLERLLETFGSSSSDGSSSRHNSQSGSSGATGSSRSKSNTGSGSGSNSGSTTVTPEEYFDEKFNLNGRDIGTPKEIRTNINKFKATVWLSEEYPLNLQEQLMPIIDIMALTSSHFSKLRDFILLQIPAGFPVKIQVPLFHVVNASITFHNIFGSEEKIQGVNSEIEANNKLVCELDDELFEPPLHYDVRKSLSPTLMNSSEDDLFQWVSNDEFGGAQGGGSGFGGFGSGRSDRVDIYEALNAPRTLIRDNTPDDDTEEQLLQRAIEESLMMARQYQSLPPAAAAAGRRIGTGTTEEQEGDEAEVAGAGVAVEGEESTISPRLPRRIVTGAEEGSDLARSESYEQLQMALAMSRREIEETERRNREEEDALAKVIELSLKEF